MRGLTRRRARAGPHGDSGAIAVVLVRGDASQGEMVVELVNAPGATRVVRSRGAGGSVVAHGSGFYRNGKRPRDNAAGWHMQRTCTQSSWHALCCQAGPMPGERVIAVKCRCACPCEEACACQVPTAGMHAAVSVPEGCCSKPAANVARWRQADEHELPMLLSRSIARPPSDRVHGLHWAEDDIEGPALLGGPEQGASPVRPGRPRQERRPAAGLALSGLQLARAHDARLEQLWPTLSGLCAPRRTASCRRRWARGRRSRACRRPRRRSRATRCSWALTRRRRRPSTRLPRSPSRRGAWLQAVCRACVTCIYLEARDERLALTEACHAFTVLVPRAGAR